MNVYVSEKSTLIEACRVRFTHQHMLKIINEFSSQISTSGNAYKFNSFDFFTSPKIKQTVLFIALLALLGISVYWAINVRSSSSAIITKENICILTTVKTGNYEMPAFNTASFRVMSNKLKDTNFKPRCEVGAPLELRYTMTFNAQKTSWQAELKAVDNSGNIVWEGQESAAIQQVGAFQYTTESSAERLLGQFLATR
jgi:hypothetical protein